jgi:hypothetical protein
MYFNGQTLVHKKTRKLARLVPKESTSQWAWDIDENTLFIDKKGILFEDDIENYECIKDELGRPYSKQPAKGQFVDESAEKYLVSKKELAKMKKKKLIEWEAEILNRMAGNVETNSFIVNGKIKKYSCESPKKSVHCPFADGSLSTLFEDFFLKRRHAVPLYKVWNSIVKRYVPGPMVFRHTDGQLWLYDYRLSELRVVMENSINIL